MKRIVGFDDLSEAKYFTPWLTTAKQPFPEFSTITVQTLVKMINAYMELMKITNIKKQKYYIPKS